MTPDTHLPISVRAYTEKPGGTLLASFKGKSSLDRASRWTLIFDCETTITPDQSLRVGFFQVRERDQLSLEGIFYDPEVCSPSDVQVISAYAEAKGLRLHTVRAFAEQIFLFYGYYRRAMIVGFNLPFDLSRIAISHSPARGPMYGGFSFRLSPNTFTPALRIKHLSRRAALIDFAMPEGQDTPQGMRRRGIKVSPHRGFFVDVKTLAAALTSRNFSLASLCDYLKLETRKAEVEAHGGPITNDYLHYARTDVQATWECFSALLKRYRGHRLATPVHRIFSEASIGKAYLREMAIQPLLACQPEFPRGLFGQIMCAYYGGRAEVRIRREIRRVIYCDFKSMYPTVNALMGLWWFVVGKGMSWRDTTCETQAFLAVVSAVDFQKKETWKRIRTIVRLKPDGDLLPVRAEYDEKSNTIGLNYLTCDRSLWFTLADVVASKLLSGKTPQILEALTFDPGPLQADLQPIDLFGNPDFHVDPGSQDVFTRLIELRDEVRTRDPDDPIENAIKIIANATSYGIFIEINRDDSPKSEDLVLYGPDGEHRAMTSMKTEQPGKYFNPLLGALITGAARLMLALAERCTLEEGLEWVFCDTDSLAIAKPIDMEEAEFQQCVARVVAWFNPLNPYRGADPILKIEGVNYKPKDKV